MRSTKLRFFLKPSLIVAIAIGLCSAMGHGAAAQSGEDRLLEVLASNASVADKCAACRELRTAGSEKSVPALASLLTDPAVSHTARIALEVMPYAAAGAALRDAASQTIGLIKSGIFDSLGERRDAEALPILVKALTDNDSQVRAAAASALGKIATVEAAEALAAAHANAEDDDRTTFGLTLVRCAARLDAAGKRDAIYAKLAQSTEGRVVRLAALAGRLRMAGPEATQVIAPALSDGDPLVRQAAAGQLRYLSDGALRDLAAKMSSLPADAQVAILAAIRIRRDKSLAQVVLKAAGADDPTIRVAAIRALGVVGDATALPLLLKASAAADAAAHAARENLQRICDPEVDGQITALLRAEEDPQRRATWIELIEARRPVGAVALLLSEAKHDRPEVRSRAMAALANLAGPKDVAAMASAVLKAEKGVERDNAEKAVMLVCQQVPDAEKRAAPVIDMLKHSNPADRAALLPLLGRIGGSEARQAIQPDLNSGNADLYEAAVRALCNWPDASVAGQLLELSEKAESATHRLWALRALIRVIALPSDMADTEKLAMLEQAMRRAQREDEQNLILQRVSAVRTVEALRFLLPYLDQPSLAQAAGASITELGRHKELRDPNKAEFIPALQRVLKTNQDGTVLEQARRDLQAAGEE